jgi:hypothetical protein
MIIIKSSLFLFLSSSSLVLTVPGNLGEIF